jgi:hypothetical protein
MALRFRSHIVHSRRGFALVITLVMVALLAIITIGVLTSVSLERVTAKSYNDRYQADLAAQNGLEAVKKTIVTSPSALLPSPASATSTDTFLVVRADSGSAPYYYLAQASTGSGPTITYYPLFSAATDPTTPGIQTNINLTASFAPAVPAPAPPADSSPSDPTAAWDAAKAQRVPKLYSWQQPNPSPSGPSVKWVEMRDPQDAPAPAPHNLPYTRYAYWAEDLDGYLDASQVGGQARTTGTNPQEIAMFTVFNPNLQSDDSSTAATTLINSRPLLFTVPTVQQIAATTPDLAGPNLAVRLGIDTAEQNLVPLGYGYGSGGQPKTPLNPISQFKNGKNAGKKFATPISNAMPNFANRTATTSGGKGHAGTVNYLNNLASNLIDYVAPLDAPTEFKADVTKPPSSRGIGAYPFVASVYDLNNWVYTYLSGSTYKVVVEVTTYIQLWNPHNIAVRGALSIHYQNSDQVNVNGNLYPLSSPPDASVILTDNPTSDPNKPTFISPLSATGTVGQAFTYFIEAANGAPYLTIQPNEYRVIALPAPGSTLLPITDYGASGLPPWLSRPPNGKNFNRISGTPPAGSAGTYSVTISATNSAGTTSATLVITINP